MESRTRTQRQAEAALRCLRAVSALPAAAREDYKARAENFPALLLHAGLAQALGFLRAKGGAADDRAAENPAAGADAADDPPSGSPAAAYRRYLADLATVLGCADGDSLLQRAIDAPLADYRLLSRQTLDAAGWLRRFAQAHLARERTP
ncbi:MAG TPA: type III-B CRISPR module-associated protein Cmr5 [Accumulibacter sp.]|nr:type III-B CRISPR module-associated protein Cmr5 [Accumulibacter sp.]